MDTRRLLTAEEQVAHLKAKGVQFHIMDEDAAREYLRRENNYFRIASYRKNYQRHPGGPKEGQYVRLEFAYLVDLAAIDRVLRDLILSMSLDVEHLAKMEILRLAEDHHEDGYTIVGDFITSLDDKERRILDGEIARNRNNTYCGDMDRKYAPHFPVWVFVEVLSLGRLCSFYRFCAERFGQKQMAKNYYRLRMCQILRNAAAHGSCMLNDLTGTELRVRTDPVVIKAVGAIPMVSKKFRASRMHNERIQQLTTLLYTYKVMADEKEICHLKQNALQNFIARLNKNRRYYSSNELIRNSFDFVCLVIDNWYETR